MKKDKMKFTVVNEETGEVIEKYYPKFSIQFDFDYTGSEGIKIDGESRTQPDMSLTVRQLLENHTRGMNSPVKTRTPLYFDMQVPVLKDLTDIEEYRKVLLNRLEETDKFIKHDLEEKEKQRVEEAKAAIQKEEAEKKKQEEKK